jgi:outer membrane protein assembly factor BamD
MKHFSKLLIILILISLNSCSKDKKEISTIKELDQQEEMITAYNEAIKNLEDGDAFYAAKKFLEAELLFPQSNWASKSVLMASYSYYLQDYYFEAIANLDRFIKTYPKDNRLAYAHYLLGMCHYENIESEKKDLKQLISAKKQFNIVIEEYPATDFALDAKFKLNLINDVLASKETYLGRHYIKKEKWIAAINRFKNVLEEYQTTIYAEEAIHRLVEVHYKIGLETEAKKYAGLLGYNYLSGEWYKESYKIFNKSYELKEIKKEKKGLIKKFKTLF